MISRTRSWRSAEAASNSAFVEFGQVRIETVQLGSKSYAANFQVAPNPSLFLEIGKEAYTSAEVSVKFEGELLAG